MAKRAASIRRANFSDGFFSSESEPDPVTQGQTVVANPTNIEMQDKIE